MKLLLACVAICCAAVSGWSLPDDIKAEFDELRTKCLAEVPGVNLEHVKKLRKHEIVEDDEDLKKYLLCFYVKGGFMKETGEYEVEYLKEKLTKIFGNHDHDKDADECTKEDHHDAITNSWEMMKCLAPKLHTPEEV